MAPTRVVPISLNQVELKSGMPLYLERMSKKPPCSDMLAFTRRRRRAVLKN
jgi:hypothetical protein